MQMQHIQYEYDYTFNMNMIYTWTSCSKNWDKKYKINLLVKNVIIIQPPPPPPKQNHPIVQEEFIGKFSPGYHEIFLYETPPSDQDIIIVEVELLKQCPSSLQWLMFCV